jgi:L-alanine-DL-glutamate epimerase-like enolase superfamily enzyme
MMRRLSSTAASICRCSNFRPDRYSETWIAEIVTMHDMTDFAPFTVKSVDTFVFRCPLETPVETSFGIMRDRPMVLVRVVADDGATGWGEVWCNFPTVGAEHRARLVDSVLSPLLVDREFASPAAAFKHLTASTAVLAIQTAEHGPIAQSIAGLDTAMWDLASRQAGVALWQALGGQSQRIPVYASGLNPTAPENLAVSRFAEGYRAFKLKIGFGLERDVRNLTALREKLGSDVRLMVDANQAWTIEQAVEVAPKLAQFELDWLEEPIRADRPWVEWHELRNATNIALAGGENIIGDEAFDEALAEGALAVVQPDLAKWGGISACHPLAKRILAAGHRYCPHYLGGGIGLLASAHLLAAVGGDGALEIDANPNPLRTLLYGPLASVDGGFASLTTELGLGVVPDLNLLAPYKTLH